MANEIDEFISSEGEMTIVSLLDKVIYFAKSLNIITFPKPVYNVNVDAKDEGKKQGERKKYPKRCYRCGKEGHIAKDCKEILPDENEKESTKAVATLNADVDDSESEDEVQQIREILRNRRKYGAEH